MNIVPADRFRSTQLAELFTARLRGLLRAGRTSTRRRCATSSTRGTSTCRARASRETATRSDLQPRRARRRQLDRRYRRRPEAQRGRASGGADGGRPRGRAGDGDARGARAERAARSSCTRSSASSRRACSRCGRCHGDAGGRGALGRAGAARPERAAVAARRRVAAGGLRAARGRRRRSCCSTGGNVGSSARGASTIDAAADAALRRSRGKALHFVERAGEATSASGSARRLGGTLLDLRQLEMRLSSLAGRRARPEIDVALGRVAVDLRELVVGEREVVERAERVVELLDARRADQRRRHALVAQRPRERQLRERLPAPLRDLVQRRGSSRASARSAGRARATCSPPRASPPGCRRGTCR